MNTEFTNVDTPALVIEKIHDTLLSEGWEIVDYRDDNKYVVNAPDKSPGAASGSYKDYNFNTPGKLLVVRPPDTEYYLLFKSADGYQIYPYHKDGYDFVKMVTTPPYTTAMTSSTFYQGIACTMSFSYNPNFNWCEQTDVYSMGTPGLTGHRGKGVVGIPFYKGSVNDNGDKLGPNVIINVIKSPKHIVVVSLEFHDGNFQHIIAGSLEKFTEYVGGPFFSASRNAEKMFMHPEDVLIPSLPILCTDAEANTFFRMEIDDAPRRNVYWATSQLGGNLTGKQLGLPIRTASTRNSTTNIDIPKIPHYGWIQSQVTTDPGINVNTLNCITIDLPIYFSVRVDPDEFKEYAPVGHVAGISFVSLYNMAPKGLYEISYPNSGIKRQVFPFTKRAGVYGYDGFSVAQGDESSVGDIGG